MKFFFAFIFSALTLIGLKNIAHADTSVNVSNTTTGNNDTHVTVNSNVNTNSTTTTTVNSNTKVHIENNGEVKDFNSDGDESVDWKSDDGKSSVKINTNGSTIETGTTVTPNKDKDTSDDQDDTTKTATPSVTQAQKHTNQTNSTFIKVFFSWLKAFFK